MTQSSNPLLSLQDLPLFDQIKPEDVAPAMEQLLRNASAALESVTAPDFPAQWSEIARVLDVSTEKLGFAWRLVGRHLASKVSENPKSLRVLQRQNSSGRPG